MSQSVQRCPTCKTEVEKSQVECRVCGMNVKTGESFQDKVKRAKRAETHPEYFHRGILAMVLFGFVIFILAGFMYQRSREKILGREITVIKRLRKTIVYFRKHIERLEELDGMVAARKYEDADKAAKTLIKDLNTELGVVRETIKAAYSDDEEGRVEAAKKSERLVAVSLLENIKAKTEHRLDIIKRRGS